MFLHNRLVKSFFIFLHVCFFASNNAQTKLHYKYLVDQDPNSWVPSLSRQLTVEDKHALLDVINSSMEVYQNRAVLIKISVFVSLQMAKVNGLVIGTFPESYQETVKENIISLAELVDLFAKKENAYRLSLIQLEEIYGSTKPFIQDIFSTINQSIVWAICSIEPLTNDIKAKEELALHVFCKEINALLTESLENIEHVAEYNTVPDLLLDQQDIFAELFYKSASLMQPTAQSYFDISLLYVEMLRIYKIALEYNLLSQ